MLVLELVGFLVTAFSVRDKRTFVGVVVLFGEYNVKLIVCCARSTYLPTEWKAARFLSDRLCG